jgi:PAS domain S-box-containing protein
MSKEYNFLILEDVGSDAELIIDEVRLSSLNCNFKCVDNEADFISQLNDFEPDIVLSDYSLPTYNGMTALNYVLKNFPEIPVIMVTGSINEETAVQCMKTGAVDYILKDKMSRLGLAVLTALKNKKNKLEKLKVEKELVKRELYYRSILKYMHDEVVVLSRDCIITDINNSMLKVVGKKREELIGRNCYEIFKNFNSPNHDHDFKCSHDKVLSSGRPDRYQQKIQRSSGEKIWFDTLMSPLFDDKGEITHIIVAFRDINDIVLAQDEIKKLSIVVEQSPVAISLMDNKTNIQFINPSFTKLTGYSPEDILGKSMKILGPKSLKEEEHVNIFEMAVHGKLINQIYCNEKKEGGKYWVSANISPIRDARGDIAGIVEIQEDITQRLSDQKQIEHDLREKELLLQEIYHRVNNNMQIMISLLNMQINRTEINREKDILRMAQSRVGAISAIHNDIYQEKSFVAINMTNVINNIFNMLCDTLMIPLGTISLDVNAEIPEFGLDLAQPCALIINELMSNCIRHAFSDGKGKIQISLITNKDNIITLNVADNGIGLPELLDPEKSDTTGFRLIYMLAIGQLEGSVNFNNKKGCSVDVIFKKIADKNRF